MRCFLPPDIVNRYDVLRHEFLKGQEGQPDTWRVMVQQGLLAWAQAEPTRLSERIAPRPLCGGGIPAELQSPITHVLAGMILHLHPEVNHVS